jgi:uncharacterized protein YfaT (DUF1175 family)
MIRLLCGGSQKLMALPHSWLRWMSALAIAIALLLVLANRRSPSPSLSLVVENPSTTLPADGVSTLHLTIHALDGRSLSPREVQVTIVDGARRAQIVSVANHGRGLEAVVRAGVEPGSVTIEARGAGLAPAQARFETLLDSSDRRADGTPDFLRLDSESDRAAFRRWFTFLAEAQAFRPPDRLPSEINDCAALIRFAYREALREHQGAWATELALPAVPAAASLEKYQYPYTPLGANLFRVQPGAFRPEDISSGAFAQFADAQTLQRLNAHFLGRDLALARPGDLLFFRQLERDLPFHSMVFLGKSQFEPGADDWVIYHTGPLAGGKGEIRRVRLRDLLRHPSPRWRPVAGNANFLGVYRWNILLDME